MYIITYLILPNSDANFAVKNFDGLYVKRELKM